MAAVENASERMRKEGISVIVCCYNSKPRIGTTLQHLYAQQTEPGIEWEIIVVDNNSDDGTAKAVELYHQDNGDGILLSTVHEPEPGLSHARERGFKQARFNIALMVDDDNWLAENYVQGIWDRFQTDGRIGMVGGTGIPHIEGEIPTWFDRYAYCYATGDQRAIGHEMAEEQKRSPRPPQAVTPTLPGERLRAAAPPLPRGGVPVTECRDGGVEDQQSSLSSEITCQGGPAHRDADLLYGAGLALRLDFLDRLKQQGFKSILSDRKGASLMSGGDTELCMAYRMAGHRLVSDPKLTFKHQLPYGRLKWTYLRRLFFGFGMTKVRIDIYTSAMAERPMPLDGRFPFWFNRTFFLLGQLTEDAGVLIKSIFSEMEGNDRLLRALAKLGQIKGIIKSRKEYLELYRNVYTLKKRLNDLER